MYVYIFFSKTRDLRGICLTYAQKEIFFKR